MNITQNVNYESIKFVIKEKSLPNPRSSRFLYMLSIRILYFFFHIQIHILSTFAKGVSSVSEFFFFFFLPVDVQLFQHHLLKRLFFSSIVLPLFLCQGDYTCMGLIWALCSVLLIYFSIFFLIALS